MSGRGASRRCGRARGHRRRTGGPRPEGRRRRGRAAHDASAGEGPWLQRGCRRLGAPGGTIAGPGEAQLGRGQRSQRNGRERWRPAGRGHIEETDRAVLGRLRAAGAGGCAKVTSDGDECGSPDCPPPTLRVRGRPISPVPCSSRRFACPVDRFRKELDLVRGRSTG